MKRCALKVFMAMIAVIAIQVILLTPAYAARYEYIERYTLVKTLEADTTGDGINEKVNILGDENNKGYQMEIVHKNGKTYRLKPTGTFDSLGMYTPWYDLRVDIADINKDGVPEIITLGSGTHEVPFHIFRWDGSDYKEIFSDWTYASMNYKDITGDDIPEVVIHTRLYGSGEKSIYYQWQNGKYRKIYYEVDAGRGFEKIRDIIIMMNNNAMPYAEDIPDREGLLRNYFTRRWVADEKNLKSLQEFNKDMLSIQIDEFIIVKNNNDPAKPGYEDKGETWKLKLKVFRIKGTKVVREDWILEAVTKFGEGIGENKWRVDSISFTRV